MNDHKKKMIAPIVITVVFLLYLVFYGRFLLTAAEFMAGLATIWTKAFADISKSTPPTFKRKRSPSAACSDERVD